MNIMSAVGCGGMNLNTVGVVVGVRGGEGGAEIWAGFKISKEMELFLIVALVGLFISGK